jgi:restriction system protein
LLVSWGGFTRSAQSEARQHFFRLRLWSAKELVEAIYRSYDRLPEEIQAELPLKRVWTLVFEDLA